MAKRKPGKAKEPKKVESGLKLEQFRAATEALTQLAGRGKLLALRGLTGSVRLVVEEKDFAASYGAVRSLGAPADTKEARDALDEVRGFLQLALSIKKQRRRLSFLEEEVFAAVRKVGPEEKARVHAEWAEKLRSVEELPFVAGLKRRGERLESATAGIVDDVDAEVVRRREAYRDSRSVQFPFLRLKLRYADPSSGRFPWGVLIGHPWADVGSAGLKSFDLECDETDIDLLMRRLVAAKELLLQEVTKDAQQRPAS